MQSNKNNKQKINKYIFFKVKFKNEFKKIIHCM